MDKTPVYKWSIFGNHKMLRHSVNFLDKNLSMSALTRGVLPTTCVTKSRPNCEFLGLHFKVTKSFKLNVYYKLIVKIEL